MDSHVEEEFSEFGKLKFWIITKGPNQSSRLTLNEDGSVTFVIDEPSGYDQKKEINKLWKPKIIQESLALMNVASRKYLKVNIQGGEFKNLSTTDIHLDDQSFLWAVNVDVLQQYSIIIESVIRNKYYQRYILYNHAETQESKRIIPKPVKPKYRSIPHQIRSCQVPHFRGSIIGKQHAFYRYFTRQYASSSYPAQKTSPHLIFYPLDCQDVKAAVRYALACQKYVVARSGGHQYSGKSSGGDDTIVIDLGESNFTQVKVNETNKDLLDVGPGVKLKDISQNLLNLGYSLPHGQCPLVCIGGHAQSGGYGHLIRAFGLNGDYVEGFEIVLTDGKQVKSYQVVRPNSKYLPAPTDISKELNDKIFTGILTGNAGSFGVITRYTYKFIKDEDHPNSWGYKKSRIYKKNAFKNTMFEVKKWTQLIKSGKDDNQLKGLDFMMTLASTKFPQIFPPITRFPLMLVELVYSDLDKKPYSGQFDQIIATAQKGVTIIDKTLNKLMKGYEKKQKLSIIADSHVRTFPSVTIDGRQFNRPYKKRINVTYDVLTDQFVNKFCDLIDKVLTEKKVKLVFQMVFGGGQGRRKGKQLNDQGFLTYPHRESTYMFVFDLFYKPNSDEEQKAIDFQEQMQKIIDQTYNHGQERRLFWGTFGDTDMNKPEIVKMYYNVPDYEKLQQLKNQLDPKDIFHTSLTVKLPTAKQ